MSTNSMEADPQRSNFPQFLQKLRSNQSVGNHYAPSNITTNITTNPLMDRQIQSSLPSLMDESQAQTHKNQVIVGSYQRLEMDSDVECGQRPNERKIANGGRHSPQSSIGGDTDYGQCDRYQSDGQTSHPSSDGEDVEASFYAQTDLAECMARAAQNAGFTFNEQSFVIEPQSQQQQQQQQVSNINKKFRHHQRPVTNFRPTSPYSTDSNMSNTATPLHNRHPPKFRRRHGSDRMANQIQSPSSCSEHSPSYEVIDKDFGSLCPPQKAIKVPNAMHSNSTCNIRHFVSLNEY